MAVRMWTAVTGSTGLPLLSNAPKIVLKLPGF
jgi:hypothetical protein